MEAEKKKRMDASVRLTNLSASEYINPEARAPWARVISDSMMKRTLHPGLIKNAAKNPFDHRGLPALLLHAPGAKAGSTAVEGIHISH
jgi:hypothetical protein